MKFVKKFSLAAIAIAMIVAGSMTFFKDDVAASDGVTGRQLVTEDMEWTYLDDLTTDPNKGTWYESWNKKNGWTYPLEWKDWGEYLQNFSDEDWKKHTGKPIFSTDEAEVDAAKLATKDDGTVGPTYFFRHIFNLDTPKDVKTIKVTVRYNDAMILYLNGKPVESFFNIPTTNYKTNLEYGAQRKVTKEEGYIEETLYMEDVSSLVDVYNPDLKEFCIAAEVHCFDPADTDAYFELVSFELNPEASALPESEAVKNIAVNVGADENSVNFAWYATSPTAGSVQIAEGSDTTGAFPEATATTVPSIPVVDAYTKFYDVNYYSNKATFTGVEPGKNYIYRVGNADGWSETYALKTSDISDGKYEIIFLSDAQVGTGTIPTDVLGWKNTLNEALGAFPNASFIANTGDFVDVAEKESEYDAYFSPEQLNQYPTASAVGNHDIAANYGYHFNEPNASSLGSSAANSDYYFEYGNVLYMVLNTSNTSHVEHVLFMEETLDATADKDYDWKVVMFHQSIYASGKQSTSADVAPRKEEFVPAFDRLGIDVVLMGHDHCYARTHQMYNFEPVTDVKYDANGAAVNPKGTVYLTTSSASGSKYYDLESEYEYLAARAQFKVPTFSHITFSEDTFTMEAYRTDTMEMFDSYSIKKTPEVVAGDKTNLQAKVKEFEALVASEYTTASWEAFSLALNEAKAVLADENASQEAIDAALTKLTAAKDALVKVETPSVADKTKLEAKVKEFEGLVASEYTTESWEAFATALKDAKAVLADKDATQEAVDAALTKLTTAKDALVKVETPSIVDKTKLQDKVKEFEGLVASEYTTDSWNTFAAAMKEAKAILADENATQEAVDAALTKLTAAKDALVKVEPGKAVPTKPSKPSSKVKTGDTTGVSNWMWLLLGSGFVMTGAYQVKKRKES